VQACVVHVRGACVREGGARHLHEEEALQVHGEPAEVVLADELVQVDVEQLEHQAQVPLVHEAVQHAHDVVAVVRVAPRVEHLDDPDLHSRLRQYRVREWADHKRRGRDQEGRGGGVAP
jgi:hypothetical protein